MSPARRIAFHALLRVERGAWAEEVLRTALSGASERDAALAWEIVFGVLRRRSQIDALIAGLSSKPIDRLDPEVLAALRLGVYQVCFLDRIPAHAAVTDSVDLVKEAGKRSAAGFVNAVLRKASPATGWPDRATALACPEWLLARWDRQYGPAQTEAIAQAFLLPPVKYQRGDRTQDIGAQQIVPLLELAPGLTFLDLCAAPGHKTLQALEAGVKAVACDRHLSRLRAMGDIGCPRVVLDGTKPIPFRARFDRILVDAPCSGTGTLGRNPEIKWRLTGEDLAELHERQALLLANALECLAPGGVLVYATCSLEEEENEAVVRRVLGRLPDPLFRRLPGRDPGDGFFAAVIRSE